MAEQAARDDARRDGLDAVDRKIQRRARPGLRVCTSRAGLHSRPSPSSAKCSSRSLTRNEHSDSELWDAALKPAAHLRFCIEGINPNIGRPRVHSHPLWSALRHNKGSDKPNS